MLGLGEDAITDAPPKGARETVAAELFPAERQWLVELAGKGGLTRNPSPARALRILVRAAMANRDLLPVDVDITAQPSWMETLPSMPDRLATWLDALPDETLDELQRAIKSTVARRKKAKG